MSGTEKTKNTYKWVIIHGHFYQPPRENPWLDIIERQTSAFPYHNWNERIYAECYRPNASSRMLDSKGMIIGIHNNYSSMSFNFGHTLFSWLESNHPKIAQKIIEGDKISVERFNGHGNAIAQIYNHIIMPLSSVRDQLTQIRWAKAAFRKTYKREPEGIWLSETAINIETIKCLIKEKISFVILSPSQAEAFRIIDEDAPWISTLHTPLDTRRPYRFFLRNSAGKKEGGYIDIFFFNEEISKEISFGNLLQDAHILGNRINSCYSKSLSEDEVVIIATDGETFGHHKPFGDMCLAYFFNFVAPSLNIQVANFGYYLSLHPPKYEVKLKNVFGEGTSWSCAHGVGRWIRNCGCSVGGKEGWNQEWRGPMRKAIDNLQEKIDERYIQVCRKYKLDPWQLRDEYFLLSDGFSWKKKNILTPSQKKVHNIKEEDEILLRRLLEAQKYILFAYTSCGWFFADISGIEAMQNLAYACRALQLGIEEEKQKKVLDSFLKDLSHAQSNIKNETGASLVKKHILPYMNFDGIICFAASIEKYLEVPLNCCEKKLGPHLKLKVTPLKKDISCGGIFSPDIFKYFSCYFTNKITGENSKWIIELKIDELKGITGCVLKVNKEKENDTAELLSISKDPECIHYNISDIFPTLKECLIEVIKHRIYQHSYKKYEEWFSANEHNLLLLNSIKDNLDETFISSVKFVLQNRWDHIILEKLPIKEQEENCFKELLEISKKASYFNIKIDLSFSASLCEKLLLEEFSLLSQDLNTEKCDRIRYIMNIVDRFGIPVSKNKLEDIFFDILNTHIRPLYIKAKERSAEVGENQKENLIKLLSFARRMNFSTDEFDMGKI